VDVIHVCLSKSDHRQGAGCSQEKESPEARQGRDCVQAEKSWVTGSNWRGIPNQALD
jgi:hypothetical protein